MLHFVCTWQIGHYTCITRTFSSYVMYRYYRIKLKHDLIHHLFIVHLHRAIVS